jgi:hypothetical protein
MASRAPGEFGIVHKSYGFILLYVPVLTLCVSAYAYLRPHYLALTCLVYLVTLAATVPRIPVREAITRTPTSLTVTQTSLVGTVVLAVTVAVQDAALGVSTSLVHRGRTGLRPPVLLHGVRCAGVDVFLGERRRGERWARERMRELMLALNIPLAEPQGITLEKKGE